MRSFRIRVSGKTYVVEIDDISASPIRVVVDGRPFAVDVEWQGAAPEATGEPGVGPATPQGATPSAFQKPAQPSLPTMAEVDHSSVDTVDAPMPGVILEIKVAPGVTVSRGDELCVLEAMKMRNSIRAPRSGEIAGVHVTAGAKVAYGVPLVSYADRIAYDPDQP